MFSNHLNMCLNIFLIISFTEFSSFAQIFADNIRAEEKKVFRSNLHQDKIMKTLKVQKKIIDFAENEFFFQINEIKNYGNEFENNKQKTIKLKKRSNNRIILKFLSVNFKHQG